MLWMPSFDIEVASRIKSGWVDRIAIEVIRDNGLKSGLDSLKLGSKKKVANLESVSSKSVSQKLKYISIHSL